MNYQNSEISLFALIFCLFLTLSTEVSYKENLPVYLECGGKLQNKFSGLIPEYILPSVTEVRRERELSEKMLKTTILSEAALQHLQDKGSSSSSSSQLCKLRGKAQWSGVFQTSYAAVKKMHEYEEGDSFTLVFE